MTSSAVILLADDDDGHALLIEDALVSEGLRNPFERFCDGQAILDFLLKSRSPERQPGQDYVVVLDVNMPKVDGIEVLRRIRAENTFRAMPIIVVSTSDDRIVGERCRSLGCQAYVQKPIDGQAFDEAMRRMAVLISEMTSQGRGRPPPEP